MSQPASFFTEADGVFTATAATRGPWSDQHQHGSPPAALLGRAIERAFDTSLRVVRLTVAFHKPIAIASYRVSVETVRGGRKVTSARAYLVPAEEPSAKPVASADAILIRRAEFVAEGPAMVAPEDGRPRPNECPPFVFPFFRNPVGYQTAMESKVMYGRFGEAQMGLWMRMRIPLLPGETPTPLQRAACAGDSGNGVSVGVDITRYTFVNPDVTMTLMREPVGEWIGLDARTTFASDGIGLADTYLLDERGPIGRATQPLLLEPKARTDLHEPKARTDLRERR